MHGDLFVYMDGDMNGKQYVNVTDDDRHMGVQHCSIKTKMIRITGEGINICPVVS